MIEFSVCLETVFTDLPPEQRIAQIAEAGFSTVEFWHPEATWDGERINPVLAKNASALRAAAQRCGVAISDFVLNAWNGLYGGCPVKRHDRDAYLRQVEKMIDFADAIHCTTLATLSGTVDPALSSVQMRSNLVEALGLAVQIAARRNIVLVLESLNVLVDHPGYYLDSTAKAVEIIREIDSPHLKLLYDVYHMQIMEGNVIATIEKNFDLIGHFHAAAVPGRDEPYDGELNYHAVVRHLETLGYRGRFGLEFFPKSPDHASALKKCLIYLRGG